MSAASPPVSVVVPAFNEAKTIRSTLETVLACRFIREVIVVDDGSQDGTVQVAREVNDPRLHVLVHRRNQGKGAAMVTGGRAAAGAVILFLDADLKGLEPDHLERLVQPVIRGRCDMTMGIFSGGSRWSNAGHAVSPILTGQRALRRDLFLSIPDLGSQRMGAEVTIHIHARHVGARIERVSLNGVSNTHKEEKMGWPHGVWARLCMYYEILRTTIRLRRLAAIRPRR